MRSTDRDSTPKSMKDSWMVLNSGSEQDPDEKQETPSNLNYSPSVHSADQFGIGNNQNSSSIESVMTINLNGGGTSGSDSRSATSGS